MATALKFTTAGKQPANASAEILQQRMADMQRELERLHGVVADYEERDSRGPSTKRELTQDNFWVSKEANPVVREAATALHRRKQMAERAQRAYDEVLKVSKGAYPGEGSPKTKAQKMALMRYFHAVVALNFNAEYVHMLTGYNHLMARDDIVKAADEMHSELEFGPPAFGFTPEFVAALPENAGLSVEVQEWEEKNDAGEEASVHKSTITAMAFSHKTKVVIGDSARVDHAKPGVLLYAPSMDDLMQDVLEGEFKLVDRPKPDAKSSANYSSSDEEPEKPEDAEEKEPEAPEESEEEDDEPEENPDEDLETAAEVLNGLRADEGLHPRQNESLADLETQPPSEDFDLPPLSAEEFVFDTQKREREEKPGEDEEDEEPEAKRAKNE